MSSWIVPLVVAILTAATTVSVTLLSLRRQRQTDELVVARANEQRTRHLLDRYQEPLVRAAYDLQSRLFNILELDLLATTHPRPGGQDYAASSTAWLFGQYFGWVEIVRREVQFLDLPERGEGSGLQGALFAVSVVCSSDRSLDGPTFQIFRSDQRAMGELMITDGHDAAGQPRSDCLGYATFVRNLRDDRYFTDWFADLLRWVEELRDNAGNLLRLRRLQHALLDVVDVIDHDHRRYAANRERVPL